MRPLARLAVTIVVAGVAAALGVGLLAPPVRSLARASTFGPPAQLGALGEVAQNSVVVDRHGNLLAVLHAEENRSPVKLDQVPRHVIDAILDVEDEKFWTHGGVNLRSTLRALVTNVQSGAVRQGGSTVTQQLVKNALLTPEKSVDRKVREAVLAVRLEDRLSKQEILERYLNIVYFGNGAYGLQAAAETYFNTRVERLTVGQAALLAGIIRNPQGYDPVKRPDQARQRRDLALDRLVVSGHLAADEAERVRREPVPRQVFTPLPPPNDYFVEEVKQRLLADTRLGETAQERYNAVFKGGLRIESTLDPALQEMAERHRNAVLPPSLLKGRFTSALATVEPGTGYVRAMVAGDDFGAAKYNLATQGKRQPGSSFKLFVLLAALEAGFSPKDRINGSTPCTINVPGHKPYKPDNYEGSRGGVMSITDATARSVNCAYARLGAMVGLEKVAGMAVELGLPKDRVDVLPAMTLGSEEATPLEMASAYAAIANDGVYTAPAFVQRVVDRRGKVVFEGPERSRRVVSAQTARVAVQVLRSVVERGTGRAARLGGRQVAGKTGTSQEHQNAWFVGFTPQLATAVWMGAPVGNVPMSNVGGRRVTGGSYPAQIWGRFMGEALAGADAEPFAAPNPKLVGPGKYVRDKGSPAEPREKRRPRPRARPAPAPGAEAPREPAGPEAAPSAPPPPPPAAPPPAPPDAGAPAGAGASP